MFAASSLVVAVLATYASVAVLSLSAAAPFSVVGNLPGVQALVKGIGWTKPTVDGVVKLTHLASSTGAVGALADVNLIDFGTNPTPAPQTFAIKNTTGTALPLYLSVTGATASSVTAHFVESNGPSYKVPVGASAQIMLETNPLYAGTIHANLEISVPNSGLTPKLVAIQGAQAPLQPGPVTATPVAHGVVDLSWTPSGSVSGVAGYIVQRAPAGSSAFQQVGTLTNGTTMVDQTSTDGAYSYQVVAVATGSSALQSPAGPVGTATADSTAPDPPASVNAPQYINSATGNSMSIPVGLDSSSVGSDAITVTLTDSTGFSITGHASGGAASVRVPIAGLNQLAEGKVTVSATAADNLGNVSAAVAGDNAITKDTIAPDAPVIGDVPVITSINETKVQIPVSTTSPAAAGDLITVQLSDGANTTPPVLVRQSAGDAGGVATVDASSLNDGTNNIAVTATVTDAAGNVSQPASATTSMDTNGPAAPTSIGVAAGPNNPSGVVTAASQSAVIVQATFDRPPPADDTMVIWVAGTSYPVTSDGQSTTYTLPPIDLSGLSDGVYNVGIKQTDPNGNFTRTWRTFTVDTGGPVAATSVGVPAGPNNPAGYVNAATQTAATIVAAFAAPTDPADQIALTVDGMPFGTQPGGSDQAVFSGDMSSLPDGVLQIQGTITDANGVSTTFSGTLTKDTQPPPAPAAAYVVGPPPNTIAPADASCIKVAVAFNQAPDPSDTVTASLSDGSTSVSGSAPAGDGQVLISCIDASSLTAGSIAVNVTVTDAAGNSTSVAGTTATKLPCPTS